MSWRLVCSTVLLVAFAFLLVGCAEPQRTAATPYSPPEPATPPASGQASITPTRDPSAESTVQIAESTHTLTGVNLRLEDLISVAHRTTEGARNSIPLLSSLRVAASQPLPAQRYDVRIFVPRGKAPELRAALAKALGDSFGLTVRREMRTTAVLVLVAPAGKLDPHPVVAPPAQPGYNRLTLTGDDLSLLAEQLEECMRQPVVNETGLRSGYDLKLRRPVRDGQPQPVDVDTVRAALHEQLGLDLTPALRSIEFLAVQQAARPGNK